MADAFEAVLLEHADLLCQRMSWQQNRTGYNRMSSCYLNGLADAMDVPADLRTDETVLRYKYDYERRWDQVWRLPRLTMGVELKCNVLWNESHAQTLLQFVGAACDLVGDGYGGGLAFLWVVDARRTSGRSARAKGIARVRRDPLRMVQRICGCVDRLLRHYDGGVLAVLQEDGVGYPHPVATRTVLRQCLDDRFF